MWGELLAKERQGIDNSDTLQGLMKAELGTLQKSVDVVAKQVITGLEAVIKMKSPYPPEYQEVVYHAARFSPGSGFDKLLTSSDVDEILQRLRNNGT